MSHISPTARNVVTCPFCKELVARGATLCPHCHSNLVVPRKKRTRSFWMGSFMLGFYTATICWLLLLLLLLWK